MIEPELRAKILAAPEVLLEDRDVMQALVQANEQARGANIVDLRGVAMARLEGRLERLEDTHRLVIAAAYDNVAGTQQLHRAVLRLLEPSDFQEFLDVLAGDVAEILRIDAVRLVLETRDIGPVPALDRLGRVLVRKPQGFVADYSQSQGRAARRDVILRATPGQDQSLFAPDEGPIASEALLQLDFGRQRLPGLLVLGALDESRFRASQGSDLLAFLGGIFERLMRRWLA